MRLSTYPLLLAGASLAAQQAAAVPVRVLVVSSHQEVSTNARGPLAVVESHHGMHYANTDANEAPHGGMKMFWDPAEPVRGVTSPAHHCGKSLRDKAMLLSNKIFGFPKMDALGMHHTAGNVTPAADEESSANDRVNILPFIGTPNDFGARPAGPIPHAAQEDKMMQVHGPGARPEMGPVRIVHMNEQDGGRLRFRHHRGPFLRRLHFALMALGPWEGRAVAFVLGCGIGVLLRTLWVMGIVMVRAFSGRRGEETEAPETVFVMDADAEEILVPPPQYTTKITVLPPPEYVDEKAAMIVDESAPRA